MTRTSATLARTARLAALAGLMMLAAAPAVAQESSPWVRGLHSRVRLVSGGTKAGRLLAGVEIALDRGFKTYWRNPGESGLPPRFDWAASANVDSVELRWPAPTRTEDQGGVAYTYADRVVFPILVTQKQPETSVRLALSLDYGICKDICIPAHANVSLMLSGRSGDNALVMAALARVPRLLPLGSDGEISILSVKGMPRSGEKPKIAVTVRRPAGTSPALFAEGPENWHLSTPAEGEDVAADLSRFLVTVEQRPRGISGPVTLRFTLVAADRAVESEATLEPGALAP